MGEQTYTEDEFKQVLKNLFAEKQRVRKLQRKFQSKLTVSDHFSKFKQAFAAKEQECQLLQERLGKVRPVIKKLLLQTGECEELKEKLGKEMARFEGEKSKLVEKLAENISQSQRQTDVIKDLHEEISSLRQECSDLKEQVSGAMKELEEKEALQQQLYQLQEKEALWEEKERVLEERLKQLEQQLEESDVAEYLEQLKQLRVELEDAQRAKERLVVDNQELAEEKEGLKRQLKERVEAEQLLEHEKVKLQTELQTFKLSSEEVDSEIRMAQQHLAKKVKEATLLRDETERQQVQLGEQRSELERVKSQLAAFTEQEERLRASLEQWQEKANGLQDQLQEQRDAILDLQKVKKQYDQIKNALNVEE